jgi:hypothetical protein
VGLALLIVPTHEALGMAWVTVMVELFILAGLVLTLARHHNSVFAARAMSPADRRLAASHRPS